MKNDYFENVFEEVGQIGKLFENVEDMTRTIVEMSKDISAMDLSVQYKALDNAQKFFSQNNIAQIMTEKKLWLDS